MTQVTENPPSAVGAATVREAGQGWAGVHCYLHLDVVQTDRFITECVAPAAQRLIGTGKAASWFFLRYWHGGPHVRIRFRDAQAPDLHQFEEHVRAWLSRQADAAQQLDETGFRAHFGSLDPEQWRQHGDVVRAGYLPETERYGGPKGLAACESVFQVSSDIAVSVLRSDDRSKVLMIGLDLLMAALSATGDQALDVVRSARRYFASWDFVEETRTDGQAARDRAEAMRRANPGQWTRRSAQIEQVVHSQPQTTHGVWHRAISELMGTLRRLAADGELIGDPMGIFWSVVHMMNNRLGLSIGDERAISWLASRVHPGWNAPADFFDDGLAAPDRGYLEASKYDRSLMASAQLPKSEVRSARPTTRHAGQDVPLPAAAALETSLDAALQARASSYGDYGGAIGLAELATLLGSAVGVAAGRQVQLPGRSLSFRTYPSPSAAYPTQVLLAAWSVDGLEPGIYTYVAAEHCLQRVGNAPEREHLNSWSPFLATGAAANGGAANPTVLAPTLPAMLILAADLGGLRQRYGLRGLRLILTESGHMAQNLMLCAAAMELKTIPLSGFADDVVNTALHLDGIDSTAIGLLPLGSEPDPETRA